MQEMLIARGLTDLFRHVFQIRSIPGVETMKLDTIDAEASELCGAIDDWKLAVRINGLSGTPTPGRHDAFLNLGYSVREMVSNQRRVIC